MHMKFIWEQYIIIAYLETDKHQEKLVSTIDICKKKKKKSLDYFEEIEDYKRCQEVVDLIKRLKE